MGGWRAEGAGLDASVAVGSAPVAPPLLTVEKVTKRFGAFVAVNEVSLEVAEGEVLGIAGPNGSGKSTLFNILTSVPYRADGGRVIFKGDVVSGLRPFDIARQGLVRTFQKDSEFRSLSARDNVLIGTHCRPHGGRRDEHTAIERALDRVGFDPAQRDRVAGNLSIFGKKQLMIATALVSEPALLMLDEPASGLTKPEIDQLRDLILTLNRSGTTIVVIEHVLALLVAVAQRLVILNEGRVLAEGDPATVVRDPQVIAAYLGGQASRAVAA